MIYFYYGSDKSINHRKANKLFLSLRDKKPDASFSVFDGDSVTEDILSELVGSQGLFEGKVVSYLKNILSLSELQKEFAKKIQSLAESQNIIIWSEFKLPKDILEKLKKHSTKSDIREEKTEAKE